MNTYMVVFTGSERSDFELFNSCSQKQVIVDFYEFVGEGIYGNLEEVWRA